MTTLEADGVPKYTRPRRKSALLAWCPIFGVRVGAHQRFLAGCGQWVEGQLSHETEREKVRRGEGYMPTLMGGSSWGATVLLATLQRDYF